MASRSSRREGADQAPGIVLDAEGLSAAAQGDSRARAIVRITRDLGAPIQISAITLTETIRGTDRDAGVHWIARRAQVVPVDASLAMEAGALLGRVGRSDTVDAVVAVTAGRQPHRVMLLTSDVDDLAALTADMPNVTVVEI